jgi:hypothetical protein
MKNIFISTSLFLIAFLNCIAQPISESDLTWNSDGFTPSKCHIVVYKADAHELRGKTHVVVIKELAENKGKTTIEDAKFLAEKIAEDQKIEIENLFFIHYIGSFSFENGQGRKSILMGTSFRRQENGRLNAASWRIVSMADAVSYTDRQFKM